MTVTKLSGEDKQGTAYFAFEVFRDPEDGMSPIGRWFARSYVYGDQSASVVKVPIPPGSRVIQTRHEVDIAFAGVTAMVVGDGDTADGWIVTGVITPGTAGDFVGDVDSSFEGAGGKYYEDGDTIDITFTGVATTGKGILFVHMISYHEALFT